jgi:hypothetical protein
MSASVFPRWQTWEGKRLSVGGKTPSTNIQAPEKLQAPSYNHQLNAWQLFEV